MSSTFPMSSTSIARQALRLAFQFARHRPVLVVLAFAAMAAIETGLKALLPDLASGSLSPLSVVDDCVTAVLLAPFWTIALAWMIGAMSPTRSQPDFWQTCRRVAGVEIFLALMLAVIVGPPYFAFDAMRASGRTLSGVPLIGYVLIPLLVAAFCVAAWLTLRLFIATGLAAIGHTGPLIESYRLMRGAIWKLVAVLFVVSVPYYVLDLVGALALTGQFSLKPVNTTLAFTIYQHVTASALSLVIGGGVTAIMTRDRLGMAQPTPREQHAPSALVGA